jgi:hypothetical protein
MENDDGAPMTPEQKFRQMLREHDYYYEMSDDHRVWQKGRGERATIMSALKANPSFEPIWKEYLEDKKI